MSVYRQIHTRIWQDAWFLDLLPEEKLLFIYLFSNEHAALCGLYELPLKTMSFETGLRTDAITLALHRFEEAGKAFHEAPYVWVPNLRKYNESSSPKVASKITSELADVPDCNLKRAYMGYYATGAILATHAVDMAEPPAEPLSIPYPENLAKRDKNKNKNKNKEPLAPKNGRPPDALFDAIAKTCQVDPATTGPSIGKVRAGLVKALPPYTPAEVEAFGKWWWGDKGMRQRPPTVWQLLEQIGVVRQMKPAKLTDREYGERLRAGTLPPEPEVFIPPSMRA